MIIQVQGVVITGKGFTHCMCQDSDNSRWQLQEYTRKQHQVLRPASIDIIANLQHHAEPVDSSTHAHTAHTSFGQLL